MSLWSKLRSRVVGARWLVQPHGLRERIADLERQLGAIDAKLAAIHRQAVPPTVNLDHVDEACPLDHVGHVARAARVWVAASNSFGFGGSNLCLVIRAAA
mgnify:CR=1 FL=1